MGVGACPTAGGGTADAGNGASVQSSAGTDPGPPNAWRARERSTPRVAPPGTSVEESWGAQALRDAASRPVSGSGRRGTLREPAPQGLSLIHISEPTRPY